MDVTRLILLYGVWLALGLIVLGIVAVVFAGRGQKWFIPRTVLRWISVLGGFVLFGIGTFSLAVFVLLDVGGKADALRAMERSHGSPAPELRFVGVDGEPAALADLEGRVVLLNFWSTWCPPCVEEMPVLDELQRVYADRGLVVLNISDEETAKVEDWLEHHPMDTMHGIVAPDWTPPAPFDALNQARPVTFAIDRNGVIRKTAMGRMNRAGFERMIRPYL